MTTVLFRYILLFLSPKIREFSNGVIFFAMMKELKPSFNFKLPGAVKGILDIEGRKRTLADETVYNINMDRLISLSTPLYFIKQ